MHTDVAIKDEEYDDDNNNNGGTILITWVIIFIGSNNKETMKNYLSKCAAPQREWDKNGKPENNEKNYIEIIFHVFSLQMRNFRLQTSEYSDYSDYSDSTSTIT